MNNDIGPLLHGVSSELDRISNQVLEESLGVGLSQFRILLVLRAEEGIRQKQIADELGQTEASVSRQIKLMDKEGLLVVRKSRQNRRERSILLTAKGKKTAEKATEILNAHHAPLFARLTEREQLQLIWGLQKIKNYLGN